ncbi:uncharacterized protein LOC110228054 isoform X2 [Arabidopsis lyrata subsp. lyrata]|uniref:uncharacterized protein LOC110228054 isoform X2 n=1 Tax=Arabidopsis lyrata subsp. lyrata TaxID=81972 RepID=UPI000A29B141|nr:uncharacterized protein LOC110228054 isoform X2 [Arabidopsis lyrata subsp. lyrata]|eukprot:XP_020879803.1 uncharacterized protein LOC110228054 isoform X2 [Arabidopsis lyrata subsp. lyrata]
MSGFDCLKLNIKFGGDVSFKDECFAYIGGFEKREMLMDPDLMTWSIFDDFPKENGVSGAVEKVWYKLSHEDVDSVRAISEDRDSGIRQLCSEALIGGEVDIYIQQGVSEPTPFPMPQPGEECDAGEESDVGEHQESDAEGEANKTGEEDRAQDDGVDPVEECMGDDPRFSAFYEEINAAHEDTDQVPEEAVDEDTHQVPEEVDVQATHQTEEGVAAGQTEEDEEDEEELERQCMDAERPDPAMDTDEEWDAFDREEREISRAKFSKDKPPYLWLKQMFHNGEEFKDQLLRYVLKMNYDVKLCKWGQSQLMAICSHENCEWKIYCSVDKRVGKWSVKTYVDAHHHAISGKARMLKQGVIARLFRDEARRRPTLSWTDIKDEIMMRYTISVSKWICQKARRMAFNLVIETQRQQFAKLWDYEGELQRSNKETHTEIVTISQANGKQQFDKFYICFEKLRRTWKSCCRPIIGLDGAFLKWELKGEILAAVGRDADNMDALRSYDPEAHEDLLKTDPRTWCRAFFSCQSSCEDVSNNLSESFNRTIKDARKLPVVNMLEEVRRSCMKRIAKICDKTSKCKTRFPPKIMQILEGNRKSAKFCQVLKSGENRYEVLEGIGSYSVNLLTRECACRQWNLTGIPCPHAIFVITEKNRDPEDYVDRHLATHVWKATYKDNIEPVNGERLWKRTGKGTIEVPDKRKKRGRPKKFARVKEPTESSTNPTKLTREGKTVTCSNCKQVGHNKGTCKNPTVQSAPPRKRGRPRKSLDDDDPWSIHNAPKRWKNAQSQSTPPVAQSQSTPPAAQSQPTQNPRHSSAPAANPSGRGRARGRPPGVKNGQGKDKGKGKGKGRGKGSDEAPRPPVFFMSPWTDKVFDVWRPEKK